MTSSEPDASAFTPMLRDSGWMGALLTAADRVASAPDLDGMLQTSVELTRSVVGLERVGIHLRDHQQPGVVFRGTFGTDGGRDTTDERSFQTACGTEDYRALLTGQASGKLWEYREQVPHIASLDQQPVVIGCGWLAVTPLLSGGELVGVMYNDAALSGTSLDPVRQAKAALFCGMLAGLVRGRRPKIWELPTRSGRLNPLVLRAIWELEAELRLSGERLAQRIGVSPGHLARAFKAGAGIGLVEYRNRLRLERFFVLLNGGGRTLKQAALDAGFGSYPQFHRVYRSIVGCTPREQVPQAFLPSLWADVDGSILVARRRRSRDVVRLGVSSSGPPLE